MSVKDNRMKCDWCGRPTGEMDRAKIVIVDITGVEVYHHEAHRGRCLGMMALEIHRSEPETFPDGGGAKVIYQSRKGKEIWHERALRGWRFKTLALQIHAKETGEVVDLPPVRC